MISKNGTDFEESICSIITADLSHQFTGRDDFYIFIYLDAELNLVHKLETSLKLKKHGLLHYFGKEIEAVRNEFINWFHSASNNDVKVNWLILALVEKITGIVFVTNKLEERIEQSIKLIHSVLHHDISITFVASKVHLSESRFSHLFKEQIGIPFRKYILWCRMQAALQEVMKGQSFTKAAYSGGFSDVAHLSRTFTEMFGVSPSEVLK
ncbi:MAG: AraC family transcriptional regulator [Chitinophagaceae bacterium]|nr:AraC family transcriptional regulator [Chitinophagaceae bacterium]